MLLTVSLGLIRQGACISIFRHTNLVPLLPCTLLVLSVSCSVIERYTVFSPSRYQCHCIKLPNLEQSLLDARPNFYHQVYDRLILCILIFLRRTVNYNISMLNSLSRADASNLAYQVPYKSLICKSILQ
jgi:hypothetical protein